MGFLDSQEDPGDLKDRSDEEILALSVDDPNAFEILLERYQDAFLRKALSVLRNKPDAEEVVQETRMAAVWFTIGFGVLGYLMRRLGISPLPFVIAYILGAKLEESARQAFAATGGDALFLFASPVSITFMVLSALVVALSLRKPKEAGP